MMYLDVRGILIVYFILFKFILTTALRSSKVSSSSFIFFPTKPTWVPTFSREKLFLLDRKANSSHYNSSIHSSSKILICSNHISSYLFAVNSHCVLSCVDISMGVQGKVRDRMEKFVVLPFFMGCVSQASISVAEQRPRSSKSDFRSPSIKNQLEEEDEDSFSGENTKHSSRFLAIPRPNISTGVNRLVKGFKSLSQLFIYEDEMEELGVEMEIGCPTDVKHVTHIGWDGLAIANPLMGWDDLITPELLSHPTPSLKPFGLATTSPENDSPTFVSLNASSSLA